MLFILFVQELKYFRLNVIEVLPHDFKFTLSDNDHIVTWYPLLDHSVRLTGVGYGLEMGLQLQDQVVWVIFQVGYRSHELE